MRVNAASTFHSIQAAFLERLLYACALQALQEAGYTAKSPAQADFLFVPAYFYAITGHKAMQLKGELHAANNIILHAHYPSNASELRCLHGKN